MSLTSRQRFDYLSSADAKLSKHLLIEGHETNLTESGARSRIERSVDAVRMKSSPEHFTQSDGAARNEDHLAMLSGMQIENLDN